MSDGPFDLKAVARRYRDITGDPWRVTRYWNDDETVWVDVYHAADHPQPGVTTWGTLGMSRFDTGFATDDGRPLRVELVAEVSSAVETFGNMLTSCALNLATGGYGLDVDTIYPDIVRQYAPDVTTAHMLLTDVFSFEGLGTVEQDSEVLTFLQAVPVTDDEFELARREGVEALTTRLEQQSADVLDLDRPSVVQGATVAPRAADVVYCDWWDPAEQRPAQVLDEATARHRYEHGPTCTVVVSADPEGSPVLLEVDAGASRVLVTVLGPGGAVDSTHLFRRRGERLFLEQVDVYSYDGEQLVDELGVDLAVVTPYGPAHVVRHEQVWFRPDGYARRTVDDAAASSVTVEDRRDVPVDDGWEAVPAFGDWASLLRHTR